jgi:hypothetical protein
VKFKILIALFALACIPLFEATSCLAQESRETEDHAQSTPDAFVYVARPNHVLGFSVSRSGKLKPLPGSPFPVSLSQMSFGRKFVIGIRTDDEHLETLRIKSNGDLTYASSTEFIKPSPYCSTVYSYATTDADGSTFYVPIACSDGFFYQEFHIEENGDIHFIGNTPTQQNFGPLAVLGNNRYAYEVNCINPFNNEVFSQTFRREDNGLLTSLGTGTIPMPPASSPTDSYCPSNLGADSTRHLAIAVQDYDGLEGVQNTIEVAVYTADAHGNLVTQSTGNNIAHTSQWLLAEGMNISPDQKFLVVGGDGFEVYHFNGGAQATQFSPLIEPSSLFGAFAWDRHDHLFGITYQQLFVFNVSAAGVVEAQASPLTIEQGDENLLVVPARSSRDDHEEKEDH